MRIVLVAAIASTLAGLALGLVTRDARATARDSGEAGAAVAVQKASMEPAQPVVVDPDWRPELVAAIDAVADAESVKGLAEEIWASAPDSVQRDEWLMALIARWVDLKGVAGIESMQRWHQWSDKGLRSRIIMLGGFAVHRLAQRDFEAALKFPFGLGGSDGPQWGALILDKYPGRLPELIEANKFSGSEADWARAGRMLAQGGWENAGLIESAFNNNHGGMRNGSAFVGFVAEMAVTDPDGAIKWAADMDARKLQFSISARSEGSPGERVREAVIKHLIESDMDHAKALASEWKDENGLRSLVAEAIAKSDLEAAAAWLDSDGEGIAANLFAAFVPALQNRSTAEVVSFFDRYPSRGHGGSNSGAFILGHRPDGARPASGRTRSHARFTGARYDVG